MRTVIAGSRTITDLRHLEAAVLESQFQITQVVSGGARGADALGEAWADRNGVPIKRFNADWNKHGKAAGMIRNKQMAEYAEALIALWDGQSRGTKNMIDLAHKHGLKVYIHMTP